MDFWFEKVPFPSFCTKICTPTDSPPLTRFFSGLKYRVKGGLPVFDFWFSVTGWHNETNHNQGQWTGMFLHILWRADSPRISFWCRHMNTNPLEIYISENKNKKDRLLATIWRGKSPKKCPQIDTALMCSKRFQTEFPKNFQKNFKELPKNSQSIPKEFPTNSDGISKEFFPKLPKNFQKLPQKLLTKYLKIS